MAVDCHPCPWRVQPTFLLHAHGLSALPWPSPPQLPSSHSLAGPSLASPPAPSSHTQVQPVPLPHAYLLSGVISTSIHTSASVIEVDEELLRVLANAMKPKGSADDEETCADRDRTTKDALLFLCHRCEDSSAAEVVRCPPCFAWHAHYVHRARTTYAPTRAESCKRSKQVP